jgi:4-diphosphocytidyl-2-C-methyl-D-erythritol kinase
MWPNDGQTHASASAPAKLNLYLQVVGKRADGYHLLDSLVVFADIADHISVERADHLSVATTGPFADHAGPVEQNLALRAAQALQHSTGCTLGAHITVEKNIPVGAGLGGGSADAAATLKLLNSYWSLGLDRAQLIQMGLTLGADVPACVMGGTLRMEGIGEVLTQLPDLPEVPILLVHPDTGLSTPQVFRALAGRHSGVAPESAADFKTAGELIASIASLRNDLEAPAIELLPVIGEVLEAIKETRGCSIARMSGSGSACFGIYANPQAAADAVTILTSRHPHWWVRAGRLSGAK